jgi:hypothetical protein
MVLLINKRGLMKEWTNSRFYNAIAWTSVAIMIGLTLTLVAISVKQAMQPATASTPEASPHAQMQRHDARGQALKTNIVETTIAHLGR